MDKQITERGKASEPLSEQIKSTMKAIARKIANQSFEMSGKAQLGVGWGEQSNGGIELKKPISLGEMQSMFPHLGLMLSNIDTDNAVGVEAITPETVITGVEFWRNPANDYTSISVNVDTGSENGSVILEDYFSWPQRLWKTSPKNKIRLESYEGEHVGTFARALNDAEKLVEDNIASGNIQKATFHDSLSRVLR